MDQASTEKLVRKAKQGNREALLELCQNIAKNVLYRVMHRVKNTQDAEDASQEVLFRVCEKIHTLREPKAFGGWLNRIIANESNSYMASKVMSGNIVNIEDYMDSAEEQNDDYLPDAYTEREEERRMLLDIIDELPERQLEAVMLYYYEGLTITEAAMSMEITKQTLARYLVLARDSIKKKIQKRYAKTGTFHAIALMNMGALLTNMLAPVTEAAAPENALWVAKAVGNCSAHVAALPAGAVHAAGGLAVLKAAGIPFLVGTVLVGGLAMGGVFQKISGSQGVDEVAAAIVFTGGEAGYEHLNPTGAQAQTDSAYGELKVRGWRITPMDDERTLYSDADGGTGEALLNLREKGADGEYLFIFSLEDRFGELYTLSRSFVMRP